MKRVQLEFISSGFRDLLLSSEVASEVNKAAREVAKAATSHKASNDHDAPSFVVKGPKRGNYGGGRVIAYVAADNDAAMRAVIYKHALERAVNEVKS